MHEPAPPLTIRLPNDGRWYRVGAIVSVVRTPGLDVIPRPDGPYQVESCTYVPGPSPSGLLQVQLRKIRLFP